MAQFRVETGQLDTRISNHYEVMMLANGPAGNLVSNTNPLPVSLGSDTINIVGNIAIPTTVNVASSPENPVHTHITEVGTSGNLSISYLPIGGNVNVTNIVSVTGNVTTNGTINVGNFPSTQTVNGTINIGNTVQVNVSNFPATQNVALVNNQGLINDFNPVPVMYTNGQVDAFGRLRISDSFTLGDYKHLYGIDPNFLDITANGGTITFQTNQACARLTTNTSPTASAIHQTKLYHQYMPGKSQLIKTTINFYGNTANVTKRTGYFDANNGIFFEQSGNGTLSFCIRTDTSGTISDARKIPQSQWNIDKCDGTGPSYFNLDITKTQIFFTDFQWLGVGRVRCGFVHDGKFVTAHEFYNSNNLETVYMSHPNLPVRCEIFNTGATTGGFMDQICSTVMAEGGYREVGQDWGATSPTMRTMAANAVLPLLAIRLKNTFGGYPHNRMSVKLETTNVFTTAENIKYRIIKLPNGGYLTGGAWSSVNANSGVEFNATATAFINGEELGNGYIAAATQGGKSVATSGQASPGALSRKNFIVQNFDSTNSEIYIISVENISSASTNVGVGLQWREIY